MFKSPLSVQPVPLYSSVLPSVPVDWPPKISPEELLAPAAPCLSRPVPTGAPEDHAAVAINAFNCHAVLYQTSPTVPGDGSSERYLTLRPFNSV